MRLKLQRRSVLLLTGFLLVGASGTRAQELGLQLGAGLHSYSGSGYSGIGGQRLGELAVQFGKHIDSGLRFGVGAAYGSYDAGLDSSGRAVSAFVEAIWAKRLSPRWSPYVGVRTGREQERAGQQSTGTWRYGWSAGGLLGLQFELGEGFALGAEAATVRNFMRTDALQNEPGVNRIGWHSELQITARQRWKFGR